MNQLEKMRKADRFRRWYDHSSKAHLGYKKWRQGQRRLLYQKEILRLSRLANRCPWSKAGHKRKSIFGLLAAGALAAGTAQADSEINDYMSTALSDLEAVVERPDDGAAIDQAVISIGSLAEHLGGNFAFLIAADEARRHLEKISSDECCEVEP